MSKKLTTLSVAALAAFLLLTNPVVADAARTITGKDIKDSSIKGKDVKNDSLTGSDVKESTLGTVPSATTAGSATSAGTATTAGSVGGLPAAQVQDKASLLFATVEPAGAAPVVTRSRGVIGAESVATGFLDVHFNRSVAACTVVASYGRTGAGGVDSRFATTRISGNHPDDPSWVGVVIWNDAGGQVNGHGFGIAAMCP